MADDRTRAPEPGRVAARTSDRVARMSEDERTELARILADRKKGATGGAPVRRAAPVPVRRDPAPRVTATPDEVAEEVARLTAELHQTERRLDRLERSFSHDRYRTGGGSQPTGRHARLLSRADRLDRQLRALRTD